MSQRLDPDHIQYDNLREFLHSGDKIELSDLTLARIQKGRNFLEHHLKSADRPIYGINTGFGSLCDVEIGEEDLEQLQENLVMSHACGTGDLVPLQVAKLMLLLKIKGLSLGYSGVRPELVQRLIDFYNNDIIPVIYEQGSLGASGDLAPLAHLSLPLLAMGEVYVNQVKRSAAEVHEKFGWEPLKLKSKEGLALLNGTQFMNAYGIAICIDAEHLLHAAVKISALSADAFLARTEPFSPELHRIRPHKGQILVSGLMRHYLKDSEISEAPKAHVQDPYSFRCIPQVLGASFDVLDHVKSVFTTEMNSVTDNPTIFPEEALVLSGGNFHGQPLAMALDYLCLAMHEAGSFSERRTYQLISGRRGLPAFLTARPGLNSGFMIPQYTAASIVSQNKSLCFPASADTIDSSNGQEDHVSMGANAATKAWRVKENLVTILAIELMNAAQAMHFRRPQKTSPELETLLEEYRKEVSFVMDDRYLSPDIRKSRHFVNEMNK